MEMVDINRGDIKNRMWFIDTLGFFRDMDRVYLKSNELNVNSECDVVDALSYIKDHVQDEISSRYGYDGSLGLLQGEHSNVKLLKKLFDGWELVEIETGLALGCIINDFCDRYSELYNHVELDKESNKICYVEESHSCLLDMLEDRNIMVYQCQDVEGEYLPGYYSDDTFYRFKVKNKIVEEYYQKYKDSESDMMLLKYYLQEVIYTISSYGLILGMNMYRGMNYIDVVVASAYDQYHENCDDVNLYYASDSASIVISHFLKKVIELKIREI